MMGLCISKHPRHYIYIDNDDDAGFSMQFPAEFAVMFDQMEKEIKLQEESVKVKVDTEEYYRRLLL